VRGRRSALRRRQGRRHLRPDTLSHRRTRTHHAALRGGTRRSRRSRQRRSRARRRHDAADHGLVHGHLFDARAAAYAGRGDRQAARDRRLARARRSDRPRRVARRARADATAWAWTPGARVVVQGFGNVGSIAAQDVRRCRLHDRRHLRRDRRLLQSEGLDIARRDRVRAGASFARRLSRRRAHHERSAARTAVRRARAGRAREGPDVSRTRARAGQADRRRRERSDDARSRSHLQPARHRRHPRHPRERRAA
jgi:hypothetical protein